MYLNCSCLLVIKNSFINSLSILDLDLFFVSYEIAVWYCFLVLDNHVSSDWNSIKLCYAVLISCRRDINSSAAIRCTSEIEFYSLDVLLTLSCLVNCDRACLFLVLNRNFFCFSIGYCHVLWVSDKICSWYCFLIFIDSISSNWYLTENRNAVLISYRRNVDISAAV